MLKTWPRGLGTLVVFKRPDVDEIVMYRECEHLACQFRKHIKTDVRQTSARNCIEEGRCTDHHSGKCQIALGVLGLLHKFLDHAIGSRGDNPAARWIRNLVNAEGRSHPAPPVRRRHRAEVGAMQYICVKYPERIFLLDPLAIGA